MFPASGDYANLRGNRLFCGVGKRACAYVETHSHAGLIRIELGDVPPPLVSAASVAHRTVDEMHRVLI